jgi:hypothetical protein
LYEVNTHDNVASDVDENDFLMPGNATLTMVTSIATKSIDTDVIISVCHARASTS